MDYIVHRCKPFSGTDYFEIGPGTYSGLHWQNGFLFVSEDDFLPAEGVVRKHFTEYDHYEMNNIPAASAERIINTWAAVADLLPSVEAKDISELLNLQWADDAAIREITEHRLEISRMLEELAHTCRDFVCDKGTFCILGL